MIWWNLILFVVSFVLTALLAPKPQIENARPDSLNPESFPRATENAPIPLILGKVRMEAPNTIWYGDFESVPIIQRIRISIFKKISQIVGHNYYLGLDLALAMGPGTVLTKIFMDDKELWTGTTSATVPTTINITQPSFWGGEKEGGGWISTGTYYPGALDLTGNPVDAYIESQVGAGNVPAYLGTAHIVFNKALIGESSQLRKMAFVLENYTNGLALTGGHEKIGEDMNPAEAIYQIMTDNWRGMGISVADLDVITLREIGELLFAESNGCSVIVTAESNGKDLVQEILRQIDAIAYQDPENGQIKFRLIRDDYDVEDLPVYDEIDVIKIVNFGRSGWDEVVAQVKITFPQRDKESDAVAISQDMATVAMIGRLRSTTLSMPFVYDKDLANRIASRERSQVSVPLFRITMEMNRNAHVLRPGDVFRLDWPEYGFSGLVLRVQEFDLGSLLDGKIIVKCLQDRFALATTVFAAPADTTWVPLQTDPTDIVHSTLIEMPKFFSERMEFPAPDGSVMLIPFAAKPGVPSNAFDMVVGKVSGILDIREPEYAQYRGSGSLATAYPASAGIINGIDSTVGLDITGGNGSSFTGTNAVGDIRIGDFGLLWVNGEWMAYTTAVDDTGGNWTLTNVYRGLLGTRPLSHSIGVRVYEFSPDFIGIGSLDDLLETETIYYKMLDRAGRKIQSPVEVVESNLIVNQLVADRPLRPRNIQINGSRTNPVVGILSSASVTWVSSNRLNSQISFETDVTEVPDIAETYDLQVYVNGANVPALGATGVTSPHLVPFTSYVGTESNDCEIRITSRRTAGDLRSSLTYAMLSFSIEFADLLLSGDATDGDDVLLLSGDATDGDDKLKLSGDAV